jgi:hypothetical protein
MLLIVGMLFKIFIAIRECAKITTFTCVDPKMIMQFVNFLKNLRVRINKLQAHWVVTLIEHLPPLGIGVDESVLTQG